MNLQDTVAKILKREVSVEEAKEFANNQFGVLATYLRENLSNKIVANKIVANKTAAQKRKDEVVGEILAKARDCAERGINNFIYQFVEGERASFPPPFLTISIENESEGTVKCAYRGDYGSYAKFVIVEK